MPIDRRRFLKYAGATAAVVGASALGLDYFSQSRLPTSNQTATTTISTSRFNFPPLAKFDLSPKYLNPTDQQTIQFTNLSTDVDGDPLTYEWLIDNQPVSTQKDYSTRLPVGTHLVRLNVSDGTTKSTVTNVATNIVTAEADQIYPTKPLHIRYKGMRTGVGWDDANAPRGPGVPKDKTNEQLDTIHDELGCNAVIIYGGTRFEDNLIEAGRYAIEKGFDRIYLTPMYLSLSIEETVERIGKFAPKVKALREMSDSVVFMVGHEFGLDTYGMIPGDKWNDRLRYAVEHSGWLDDVRAKLPEMFRRIIQVCNENYGHKIAYAAAIWEDDLVPWDDPSFESVGTDAYIKDKIGWSDYWVVNHLSRLKRYGKPVNSTEWGSNTYTGASSIAGADLNRAQSPYDEDEQANYIQRYFEMLNKANINGAFYTQYNDESANYKGYCLYNGKRRKKGFYMYKSYQRTR